MEPTSWTFLQAPVLGGSSSWIYPGREWMNLLQGSVGCYEFKFNSACPNKDVTLRLSGTGVIFVWINGQTYVEWGAAWPSVVTLNIPTQNIRCGCNTIKVCVFNYYYASPAALIYEVSQNTLGCFSCSSSGLTTYNPATCRCECSSSSLCSGNNVPMWFGQPCCSCPQSLIRGCPADQYFNKHSCRCECTPKCCLSGRQQDPSNCQCVQKDIPELTQTTNGGMLLSGQQDPGWAPSVGIMGG